MKVTIGTFVCLLAVAGSASAQPTWHIWCGHQYALTPAPGSWLDAQVQAESFGGDLVTIGSQAENDWLLLTFGQQTLWIGFYQPPGTPEPDQGWEWVSGEPVAFTHWRAGRPEWTDQPNEYLAGDDYAIMNNNQDGGPEPWGFWDDVPLAGWPGPHHGVIEVVPEPASVLLLAFAGAALPRHRTSR